MTLAGQAPAGQRTPAQVGAFFADGHALRQCDATTGHVVKTVALCEDAALAECLSESIAERDALTHRVKQLEAALRGLEELYARDGESHNDRFERVAAMFYRDTGVLAPGKDDSCSGLEYEERKDRFEAWYAKRVAAARAALALATGSQP